MTRFLDRLFGRSVGSEGVVQPLIRLHLRSEAMGMNDSPGMEVPPKMPFIARGRAIYRRHAVHRFEAAPPLSLEGGKAARNTAMLLSYADRGDGAPHENRTDGRTRPPRFAEK